jgi:hypothetical protein
MKMFNTTSKTHLASIAVFAALAIVPAGARADDGGDGGAYDFPAASVVSNDVRIEERVAETPTCATAKKASWFENQLEITDGYVATPMGMPRECEREIYATAGEATE